MKEISRILFVFLSATVLSSCIASVDNGSKPCVAIPVPNVDALVFTMQPVSMTIATYNNGVTLSCKAQPSDNDKTVEITYQWYQSEDGTIETGILQEGSNSSTFTTDVFTEKGIRYYYCAATAKMQSEYGISNSTVFSDVVTVAYTGLPLIKIETEDGANPSEAKEKHNGRIYLIRNGQTVYDSGEDNELSIKVRENATAYYPKKSYKLKLPKKANLLDSVNPLKSSENKDKNWVLLAGYCDKTLLRTMAGFYTASIFNELDGNEQLYVPQAEFVDVMLNGEYIGNYTLTDSVKEGSGRVPVNEKSEGTGGIGFIAEYDFLYYENEPKWFKSSQKQYPYTFKFPDTDDANFDGHMADFETYINRFESALYDSETTDDWKNYIDIESFARWFLVNNVLANIEPNFYFHKESSEDSSKLVMGPFWDFEWSIGIGWYAGTRPRSPEYWSLKERNIEWYFADLIKKNEFKTELKTQWTKLKGKYPDLAKTINDRMDEWAGEIDISQQMNFKKWDILNQRVSVGGIPLGSYGAELECDKQFITERVRWLDDEITGL